MAIEIIKRGEKPVEKKYKTECSTCRTEFTYEESDIIKKQVQYGEWYYIAVECPVCENRVSHNEKKRIP